jgi:hypothetical protein
MLMKLSKSQLSNALPDWPVAAEELPFVSFEEQSDGIVFDLWIFHKITDVEDAPLRNAPILAK